MRLTLVVPATDDPPDVRDLGEELVVRVALLRPAGQVDARGRVLADVAGEHLPEVLGEKRHHRGDHANRLGERVPERP